MASSVSDSVTATGAQTTISTTEGNDVITATLSGTYVATMVLERRMTSSPAAPFEVVAGPFSTDDASETVTVTSRPGGDEYRWNCTAYTSGTVTAAIEEGDRDVQRWRDYANNERMRLSQAGLTVTGFTRQRGRAFGQQAAPTTATGTATLTDAQMIGGILEATPTAAATYTLRTGAQLDAAFIGDEAMAVDDYFDLTIINLGGTTDDITVAVDTGITAIGDLVVRPGADAGTEQAGQGTFRFRKTAADTFVVYRVS